MTIRPQCVGERCSMCPNQAHFKVAEELQFDEPKNRHPMTAYVCKWHFANIMGISWEATEARRPPSLPPTQAELTAALASRYEADPVESEE